MSEYAQFGDDVVVSAVTRQWIIVDQQTDFFVPFVQHRRLQETENTQITCSIRYTHKYYFVVQWILTSLAGPPWLSGLDH